MGDALISAKSRTPMLVTQNDQLLLCGAFPPSLEDMVASVTKSRTTTSSLLRTSVKSYPYHAIVLARQLSDTIAGDYARLAPLSETAVFNFLSSLSSMNYVVHVLFNPVDTTARNRFVLDDASRLCVFRCVFGFTGLVLPFYRELVHRETSDGLAQSPRAYERLQFMRAQARDMAIMGAHLLARAIRYLPKIHYAPAQWNSIYGWVEFCAEEVDSGAQLYPEFMQDLETLANELKFMGYMLQAASEPHYIALVKRLEGHANLASIDISSQLDFFLETAWMGRSRLMLTSRESLRADAQSVSPTILSFTVFL
ncbi:Zn(2)-C6 fungal-type domain-containing protein [Mycena venus]|uniref:Zn(2)-C6 fungal-type domain-containing protein n=1 Tax=Mycena venus TaxID=2733690 RepID=A0A8H6XKE2_9AGAR|nr:Zn(2)-C6 fungal-type domain-containing protein [Mycena venus]